MRHLFYSVVVISMLFACKSAQVFQVTSLSEDVKKQEVGFVFENETIKITYDFWAEKGQLHFHIYNKLKTPLYIDWKKSSFIPNDQKLDYWIDQSTTDSRIGTVAGYNYYGYAITKGAMHSSTTKQERTVFLAPQSNLDKNFFILYPTKVEIKHPDTLTFYSLTKQKNIEAGYIEFDQVNTPLKFRSYLTITFSEEGANPFVIDNAFYISRVIETKMKNINQDKTTFYISY